MDEYSSTPEHLFLLVSKTTVDFHFGKIKIVRFENTFSVEFKYVLKIEGAYFLWECLSWRILLTNHWLKIMSNYKLS